MKKGIIALICIYICSFSCINFNKPKITYQTNLIPNENLVSVLDSFVKEVDCKNCIYEIYIDKKMPDIYHTIIYAGGESLIKTINEYKTYNSLNKCIVGDIEFYIYSGLEKYFSNPLENNTLTKNNKFNSEETTWILIDSLDVQAIYKIQHENIIPFFPFPYFDGNDDLSSPVMIEE